MPAKKPTRENTAADAERPSLRSHAERGNENNESNENMPALWVRGWVTLALLWHLTAIVVGPWSTPARPGQPPPQLAHEVRLMFRPYIDTLYLGHGYKFFAPDPGGWSHLVRYELEFSDGRPVEQRTFPDPAKHWPRLRYHRYLMLSERLASAPPDWVESYGRHLLWSSGASGITLYQRKHLVPQRDAVLSGWALSDPRLYEETPLAQFRTDADERSH